MFKDIFRENCWLLGIKSFSYYKEDITFDDYNKLYIAFEEYRIKIKYLYAFLLTIKGIYDFVCFIDNFYDIEEKFLDSLMNQFENYFYDENNLFDRLLCYNENDQLWEQWESRQLPMLEKVEKEHTEFREFLDEEQVATVFNIPVKFNNIDIRYSDNKSNVEKFAEMLKKYDIQFDPLPLDLEDNDKLISDSFIPSNLGVNLIRALKIFLYGSGISAATLILLWLYNPKLICLK